MKALFFAAMAVGVFVLLLGCTAQQPAPAPGSDRDAYGCIPSAGYSWCAALNKCIRPWEETCAAPSPSSQNNSTQPSMNNTNQTPPQPRPPGKLGEFCGGIAAFQCEEGLDCVYDGTYPDAGGSCQKRAGAQENEMCGGPDGISCRPGLQCITSGMANATGTCTQPSQQQEMQNCPTTRNQACTKEYNPVCGRLVGGSAEVAGYRDYGNPCMACATDSNAIGYYYGTCEDKQVS